MILHIGLGFYMKCIEMNALFNLCWKNEPANLFITNNMDKVFTKLYFYYLNIIEGHWQLMVTFKVLEQMNQNRQSILLYM